MKFACGLYFVYYVICMSNYNDNECVKYNLFVTMLISDYKNLKKI